MLYLYAGKEMENKYRHQIVYDADTYFQWDEVKEFSPVELDAIKTIDGAVYDGDGVFISKIMSKSMYHTGSELSMGCRMLLNLIRHVVKDGKYIYDFTNAGPNVIEYLFGMKQFSQTGENRKVFLDYPAIDSLPDWGIYFNDNPILYTHSNYEEFTSKFLEVVCV